MSDEGSGSESAEKLDEGTKAVDTQEAVVWQLDDRPLTSFDPVKIYQDAANKLRIAEKIRKIKATKGLKCNNTDNSLKKSLNPKPRKPWVNITEKDWSSKGPVRKHVERKRSESIPAPAPPRTPKPSFRPIESDTHGAIPKKGKDSSDADNADGKHVLKEKRKRATAVAQECSMPSECSQKHGNYVRRSISSHRVDNETDVHVRKAPLGQTKELVEIVQKILTRTCTQVIKDMRQSRQIAQNHRRRVLPLTKKALVHGPNTSSTAAIMVCTDPKKAAIDGDNEDVNSSRCLHDSDDSDTEDYRGVGDEAIDIFTPSVIKAVVDRVEKSIKKTYKVMKKPRKQSSESSRLSNFASFVRLIKMFGCVPNHKNVEDMCSLVLWVLGSAKASETTFKKLDSSLRAFKCHLDSVCTQVETLAALQMDRGHDIERADRRRNMYDGLRSWYTDKAKMLEIIRHDTDGIPATKPTVFSSNFNAYGESKAGARIGDRAGSTVDRADRETSTHQREIAGDKSSGTLSQHERDASVGVRLDQQSEMSARTSRNDISNPVNITASRVARATPVVQSSRPITAGPVRPLSSGNIRHRPCAQSNIHAQIHNQISTQANSGRNAIRNASRKSLGSTGVDMSGTISAKLHDIIDTKHQKNSTVRNRRLEVKVGTNVCMEKFLRAMHWTNVVRVPRCRFTDWRSDADGINTDIAMVAQQSPLSLIASMLVDDFIENTSSNAQQSKSFLISDTLEDRKTHGKTDCESDGETDDAANEDNEAECVERQRSSDSTPPPPPHRGKSKKTGADSDLDDSNSNSNEGGENDNGDDRDKDNDDGDDEDDDDATARPKYRTHSLSKDGSDRPFSAPTSPGTPGPLSGMSTPTCRHAPPTIAQRDVMFHKLAPKLSEEQVAMVITALLADSARSIIMAILVLVKHSWAGKAIKDEDVGLLLGAPCCKVIGPQLICELVNWLKANKKTESSFKLANQTHSEMALQQAYCFWPELLVMVSDEGLPRKPIVLDEEISSPLSMPTSQPKSPLKRQSSPRRGPQKSVRCSGNGVSVEVATHDQKDTSVSTIHPDPEEINGKEEEASDTCPIKGTERDAGECEGDGDGDNDGSGNETDAARLGSSDENDAEAMKNRQDAKHLQIDTGESEVDSGKDITKDDSDGGVDDDHDSILRESISPRGLQPDSQAHPKTILAMDSLKLDDNDPTKLYEVGLEKSKSTYLQLISHIPGYEPPECLGLSITEKISFSHASTANMKVASLQNSPMLSPRSPMLSPRRVDKGRPMQSPRRMDKGGPRPGSARIRSLGSSGLFSPMRMSAASMSLKSLHTRSYVSVPASEYDARDLEFRRQSEKLLPEAKCSVRLCWPDKARVLKALKEPDLFSPNLSNI